MIAKVKHIIAEGLRLVAGVADGDGIIADRKVGDAEDAFLIGHDGGGKAGGFVEGFDTGGLNCGVGAGVGDGAGDTDIGSLSEAGGREQANEQQEAKCQGQIGHG